MEREEIDQIENLIVRRSLLRRLHGFLFSYGDGGSKYSRKHGDSTSHSDRHLYGDYSEGSGHTDCSSRRRSRNARHSDTTRHIDTYGDHQYMDAD